MSNVVFVTDETPDWTCVLSGPLAFRAGLLADLANAGYNLDDLPSIGGNHNFPHTDSSVGWVTVRHSDINEVNDVAKRRGWSLKAHWPTPRCRECDGISQQTTCRRCKGTGRANNLAPAH